MNFGEVEITTTSSPEGGLGVFKPSYLNINLAYAKAFSNSIYGGLNVKLISESIEDASAMGIAIDAGIQYVTGEQDQIKFGVALKNVGPPLSSQAMAFPSVALFHRMVMTTTYLP